MPVSLILDVEVGADARLYKLNYRDSKENFSMQMLSDSSGRNWQFGEDLSAERHIGDTMIAATHHLLEINLSSKNAECTVDKESQYFVEKVDNSAIKDST